MITMEETFEDLLRQVKQPDSELLVQAGLLEESSADKSPRKSNTFPHEKQVDNRAGYLPVFFDLYLPSSLSSL